MGLYTGILLQTLARTAVAGTGVVQEYRAPAQPAAGPRKKRGAGCKPCQALKAVDKAKRFAGVRVAPPLSAAEAKKLGIK